MQTSSSTPTTTSPPASEVDSRFRAITVQRQIAAPSDAVYRLVADVTRMGDWSPETVRARWADASPPRVGTRFVGKNKMGWVTWTTKPEITALVDGREFAFFVPSAARSRWRYTFTPNDGGTLVVEEFSQERREPLPIRFLTRLAGITDRTASIEHGLRRTLDNLAIAAESLHPTTH